LAWHQQVNGLTAAGDDRWVLRVERDPKMPHPPVARDATVAEIQTKHIAVRFCRELREVMGDAAGCIQVSRSNRPSAAPISHRRSRYVHLACNRAIVQSGGDEPLGGMKLLGRLHGPKLCGAADRLVGALDGTIGTPRECRNWQTRWI
jgi:hypothetical protein